MIFYPTKTIVLKDGRTAVLRSPKQQDAAEMLAYLKTVCGETDFLANYPDEYDMVTEESESEYLKNNLESKSALMIVAEIDGIIAGNCQINLMTSRKTLHRATVCIALIQKYCSLGIGTAMFAEMETFAREHGIRQLELDVISGNDIAIGLYHKAGFTETGIRPDAFRLSDGTFHDEIYMRKLL